MIITPLTTYPLWFKGDKRKRCNSENTDGGLKGEKTLYKRLIFQLALLVTLHVQCSDGFGLGDSQIDRYPIICQMWFLKTTSQCKKQCGTLRQGSINQLSNPSDFDLTDSFFWIMNTTVSQFQQLESELEVKKNSEKLLPEIRN